jgi:FtsH-binding integral membrane protein
MPRPCFRGPERLQFTYDSRVMIDVPDVRKEFRRQVYQTLGLALAALALLALWQRKRLAFYAGAWA